jgi:hypothetical protein
VIGPGGVSRGVRGGVCRSVSGVFANPLSNLILKSSRCVGAPGILPLWWSWALALDESQWEETARHKGGREGKEELTGGGGGGSHQPPGLSRRCAVPSFNRNMPHAARDMPRAPPARTWRCLDLFGTPPKGKFWDPKQITGRQQNPRAPKQALYLAAVLHHAQLLIKL